MRLLCNYLGLCPIQHFLEAVNLLMALLDASNRLGVDHSVRYVIVPIIVHGIFEHVWVRLLVISKLFVNTDRRERSRYYPWVNDWGARGIFVRNHICRDRVLWVDPLRWFVSLKGKMICGYFEGSQIWGWFVVHGGPIILLRVMSPACGTFVQSRLTPLPLRCMT